MAEKFPNEYRPDVVSFPGETLLEVLEDRGMTQAELAERMGRPKKTVNEIINGKAEITPETAIQLERVLGVAASFWNNLEGSYRDFVARSTERERLKEHLDWADQFPVSQMVKLGWIRAERDRTERVRALLSFFAVSSIEQWSTRYRGQAVALRSSRALVPDVHALTAWLRQGEREAQEVQCSPFELNSFKAALIEARTLTRQSDPAVFLPRLRELCARSGVALVVVRELRRSRAWGATRWLNPLKALVQLSLRYKTDDHLWFTFFHEAGHIVLHGKRDVFVEVNGSAARMAQEEEANRFAGDHLIPRHSLSELLEDKPLSRQRIVEFADLIGVAPGIVVGRLQHDEQIPFSHLNDLKVSFRWDDERD